MGVAEEEIERPRKAGGANKLCDPSLAAVLGAGPRRCSDWAMTPKRPSTWGRSMGARPFPALVRDEIKRRWRDGRQAQSTTGSSLAGAMADGTLCEVAGSNGAFCL